MIVKNIKNSYLLKSVVIGIISVAIYISILIYLIINHKEYLKFLFIAGFVFLLALSYFYYMNRINFEKRLVINISRLGLKIDRTPNLSGKGTFKNYPIEIEIYTEREGDSDLSYFKIFMDSKTDNLEIKAKQSDFKFPNLVNDYEISIIGSRVCLKRNLSFYKNRNCDYNDILKLLNLLTDYINSLK